MIFIFPRAAAASMLINFEINNNDSEGIMQNWGVNRAFDWAECRRDRKKEIQSEWHRIDD